MALTPTSPPTVDDNLRKAISMRERPRRASPLSASLTFGWRGVLKIKHVPEQLFDVTLMPIMFTLMFTYLFGGAIAGSTGEYLQFLLPGMLVQTIVFVTVYTGFTLNTDITKGVFDRFRSLPVWGPTPLIGMLMADTARYLVASTVVLTLGFVLGFRPEGGITGVALAVLVLLVFSFGIGWIFTAFGLIMRSPNAVMGISMTFLFPLTFASNVFVQPETMPSWLQAFVNVNPITHVVTAVRGLMAGSVTAAEIGWVMLSAALLTAVFAPITMYLYRNKR